jgi:predicted metal-binding membrane protein
VAGALGVVVALAWGYVLWLAADMDMDGMDMDGLRMIPAGIGIMAPANAPWRAVEFAFVFAMWAVMMVGMMAPFAAPIAGSTGATIRAVRPPNRYVTPDARRDFLRERGFDTTRGRRCGVRY